MGILKNLPAGILSVLFVVGVSTAVVKAANTPELSQEIIPGVLATDILDNTQAVVASPAAALTAKNFAFTCYTGAQASTGVLGTNTERIYVMNPDAADNGWTLTIAATGGATDVWENTGATQTFDYNDSTASGCTDGGDADTLGGQLSLDPSSATLTTDCDLCTTTAVTLGSAASFVQGSVDSITLINAAAGSNDAWRGYITGVDLEQSIPAEQAVDDYTVDMTLTATAL